MAINLRYARRAVIGAAICAALPLAAIAQTRMLQRMQPRDLELIYVPTPQSVVDKMLEVAKVTKDDYVFDLGSGDGRIPITAAMRYGARGFGVDINPKLIAEARANAKAAGVSELVEFRQQDLFRTSIREATVVGLYLYVWANVKLRPRLVGELRPGSRIVAHDFPIGDDWQPDVIEEFENRTVYLWYVPGQVAGTWTLEGMAQPITLHLQQNHQVVQGTADVAGRSLPLRDVALRGDAIDFTIEPEPGKPLSFHGKVEGSKIEPRPQAGGASGWTAVRVGPTHVLRTRG